MTRYTINIISDVVCSFCWIGKRRLDRAIAAHKATAAGAGDTFDISWSAFYLDPNAPTVGVPLREANAQKFGAQRWDMMHKRIQAMAAGEGLTIKHEGKTGRTRDAHRLMQLAKEKGHERQVEVMDSVMKAYFEEGIDITDHDALVKAVVRGGLEEGEARAWLKDGKGGNEVDQEVNVAYMMGLSGVPHFVINGESEVGGAQEVEVFLEEFQKVKAGEAKGKKDGEALFCGPDGCS